jgi:hypothetical protein
LNFLSFVFCNLRFAAFIGFNEDNVSSFMLLLSLYRFVSVSKNWYLSVRYLLVFKNMCCEIGPVAVIVFGFFLIAQGIFALFTVYIPAFANGFVLWEAWLICVLSILTGVVGIVSGAIACGQVGL